MGSNPRRGYLHDVEKVSHPGGHGMERGGRMGLYARANSQSARSRGSARTRVRGAGARMRDAQPPVPGARVRESAEKSRIHL